MFQVGWQDWQDVAKVGKGQRSSGRQFLFDSPANSGFFSCSIAPRQLSKMVSITGQTGLQLSLLQKSLAAWTVL